MRPARTCFIALSAGEDADGSRWELGPWACLHEDRRAHQRAGGEPGS